MGRWWLLLTKNKGRETFCVFPPVILVSRRVKYGELIAIAKALKIPVSKGDVNGSAVCVCVCGTRLH